MANKHRFLRISKLTLSLVLILSLISTSALLFFYQRRNCLTIDFLMCVSSKIYNSKTVNLSFRYPAFFPFAQPDEEWELKQAVDGGRVEVLDFSKEFYFNAEEIGSGGLKQPIRNFQT